MRVISVASNCTTNVLLFSAISFRTLTTSSPVGIGTVVFSLNISWTSAWVLSPARLVKTLGAEFFCQYQIPAATCVKTSEYYKKIPTMYEICLYKNV